MIFLFSLCYNFFIININRNIETYNKNIIYGLLRFTTSELQIKYKKKPGYLSGEMRLLCFAAYSLDSSLSSEARTVVLPEQN